MNTTGFRDFLLKAEIMKAIVDCGFEHPSAVQAECIPVAIQRTDVICQAKSGMGKTAVFVLSTLQQLDITGDDKDAVHVLVMCHTRELANQIFKEYERFTKYLPEIKTMVITGGFPISQNTKAIAETPPVRRSTALPLSRRHHLFITQGERNHDELARHPSRGDGAAALVH